MQFEDAFSRRNFLWVMGLAPAARLVGQTAAQAPGQTPAQTPGQNPTFSAGVKVVSLFANVRDKQGQIVRNLTKDDFLLDEDGRPQTIAYFSQESDLPLTLGLLVDTSSSQLRVLGDERSASYRFLEQVLREDKDLAFVLHFDFDVELLQDLTSSRAKLEKALNLLDAPQMQRRSGQGGGYPGGGGGYPGGGGGRRGGGTTLYDAVLLAGDELMRKQTGRKALIILSDGVDNGSRVSLAQGVESAQRADTLVYSILFADPNAYGNPYGGGGFGGPRMGRHGGGGGMGRPPVMMNRPDGRAVLQRISRETGGRFFEVSHKDPIGKIFDEIEEDLRHQYSLGYTPDKADDPGAYRRIHLAAKQKGLIVQAREGYYPA
jgi:VWFA-related protein